MKSDNYCMLLLLLLFFLMYVDNSNNIENYSNFEQMGASLDEVEKGDGLVNRGMGSPFKPIEGSGPIGQAPKKLAMKPPTSMTGSVGLLSYGEDTFAPANMIGGPLLSDYGPAGVKAVDSQIPTPYPRVGGVGNMGGPSGNMGGPSGNMGGPSTGSKPTKNLEVHMVHTTWCGHSKNAMPDYDKLIAEFNGKQVGSCNVSVLKHDAETDEGKAVAKKYNVKGFPTHFLIHDGKKIDAKGRKYEELSAQIKSLCS
jgi:thiol-disulfide isomerase/thioredoxin